MKLLIILLLLPLKTFALEFGLEQGESNSYLANPEYYTSSKYSAVTVRRGYFEAIQGSWYGESTGRFLGLSGAYRSSGKDFFDGSFGGVYLRDYQGSQLDGKFQFTFAFGVGRRFDGLLISVKFRHFSNGNTLGKNWGQDFIILSVNF